MKSVQVSDEVWAELLRLKADFRARSIDEVLRRVLGEWKRLRR